MEVLDLFEWKRKFNLYEVFWELPAPFLIEEEWGLVGLKSKEVKDVQIGPLECTAEERNDC